MIPMLHTESAFPRPGATHATVNQERRVLIEQLLESRGRSYVPFHLTFALRFEGQVDTDAIGRAMHYVAAIHPAVRSRISSVACGAETPSDALARFGRSGTFTEGFLRQFVFPHVSQPTPVCKLTGQSPDERAADLRELIDCEIQKPFNYASGPLYRHRLFDLGSSTFLLLVVIHHLVGDTWSLRLMRSDLLSAYEYFAAGGRGMEMRERVGFGAFADQQHRMLESNGFRAALRYWREQWLEHQNYQVRCEDFARQSGEVIEDSDQNLITLDPDVVSAIRLCCVRQRVTPFTVLLAATTLGLKRSLERDRVAVRINFANRLSPHTKGVVGWISNSHLIGFKISDEVTPMAALQDVRNRILEATCHQELALPMLWNRWGHELHPDERSISFEYMKKQAASVAKSPATSTVTPVAISGGLKQPALRLFAIEEGETIRLSLSFPAKTLGATSAMAFLRDVKRSVLDVVTRPHDKVGRLATLR